MASNTSAGPSGRRDKWNDRNQKKINNNTSGASQKQLEVISNLSLASLGRRYGDLETALTIENYKFLASYNWVKAKEPTLFVPGSPAQWMPPPLPRTLPKDDQKQMQAEVKGRIPLESRSRPFFITMSIMQPSHSLLPINLVADRNSLRKLLDFVSGKKSRDDWQIDAEMVKDTLFLTRWENHYSHYIVGRHYSGYGKSFEHAFLKYGDGVENSNSHQRIVEYKIGGMKWIVQFEADGYVDNIGEEEQANVEPTVALSKSVDAVLLRDEVEYEMFDGVKVLKKGNVVSPDSIIEVKSRQVNSQARLKDTVIQLWLSQTKHMFVGKHREGVVEAIEEVDFDEKFVRWEKDNQETLRKLMQLIEKVKEAVRQMENGRGFVAWKKQEPTQLEILKPAKGESGLKLSKDIFERFWGERTLTSS